MRTSAVGLKAGDCFIDIAVDLPHAAIHACPVLDESPDVFRRIAQEQSDFMRKFLLIRKPFLQMDETLFHLLGVIAKRFEDFSGFFPAEVFAEVFRTVHIDERAVFLLPERADPDTVIQFLIQLPEIRDHSNGIRKREGKQIRSLEPGQDRSTILHDHLIRYIVLLN